MDPLLRMLEALRTLHSNEPDIRESLSSILDNYELLDAPGIAILLHDIYMGRN